MQTSMRGCIWGRTILVTTTINPMTNMVSCNLSRKVHRAPESLGAQPNEKKANKVLDLSGSGGKDVT